MIDLSQISQLTLDGRKVVKLAVDGRTVWSEPAGSAGIVFTALSAGSSVTLSSRGSQSIPAPSVDLLSSSDGKTWAPYTVGSAATLASPGDQVMFKAGSQNGAFATNSSGSSGRFCNFFTAEGLVRVEGSLQGLISGDAQPWQFASLFENCSALADAGGLYVDVMQQNCCYDMFRGCSALTAAPALPESDLSRSCYSGMFSGCTGLSSAPALPAASLAANCYSYMFRGCSSLTAAPALTAASLTASCYSGMFSGCSSLTAAPALTAASLAANCYAQMFADCVGLAKAPRLPAAAPVLNAYQGMFSGCSSLAEVDVGLSSWGVYMQDMATMGWLTDVAASGVFKCLPELGVDETIQRGENYCPTEWTVQRFVDYVPYVNVYGAKLDTGFAPTSTMSFRTVISTSLESNDTGVIGNGANNEDTTRLFYSSGWGWMFDLGEYTNRAQANISQPNHGVFDISCWNLGIDLSASNGTTIQDLHNPATTGVVFPQATLSVNAMTPAGSRNFNISCLQIYDDGMLARDFWAARDQNGTACMWDTVSQQYFYPVASPYYPVTGWTVVE